MTSIALAISPSVNSAPPANTAPAIGRGGHTQIGRQRQHEEQPAQHVTPLGDPGHAFDVLRMNGQDRGHQRAGPQLAGHLPQHQKQPDHRGGVQQDVRQMMPQAIQPKSWQSSMCESMASGYHSPIGPALNA